MKALRVSEVLRLLGWILGVPDKPFGLSGTTVVGLLLPIPGVVEDVWRSGRIAAGRRFYRGGGLRRILATRALRVSEVLRLLGWILGVPDKPCGLSGTTVVGLSLPIPGIFGDVWRSGTVAAGRRSYRGVVVCAVGLSALERSRRGAARTGVGFRGLG
jgi:hypothetical protein